MNNTEKWQQTGLLSGISEKLQDSVALCLESQRLFNEKTDLPADFKRLSIPVLRRLVAESKAFKNNFFVDFQESSHKPEVFIFNTKLKAPVFNIAWATDEQKAAFLEQEANYTAEFSKKLSEEFDQLFKDQTNKKIYFQGFGSNHEGTVYLHYNLA